MPAAAELVSACHFRLRAGFGHVDAALARRRPLFAGRHEAQPEAEFTVAWVFVHGASREVAWGVARCMALGQLCLVVRWLPIVGLCNPLVPLSAYTGIVGDV